ncbi:MAG: sugar phosphate isomerase/epimerase [Burkholderiales bacterium]|nr:sugar phosphate isomerase/epimerase [Anaerolineae bacterium]
MRFGVNLWTWISPFTTEKIDYIEKVRRMGYDWVEIPIEDPSLIDFERVGAVIRDAGMGVSTCAAMGPDRDLTIDDATINQSGKDYLKACIDGAAGLGSGIVAGPVYATVGRTWQSEGDQRRRELERCAGNLREVAAYAHDKGVTLALEALNRFETSFINTTEQALELVGVVDSPALQLMADTFHMNIEEKHIGPAMQQMGTRLVHIHANENDRGIPGSGHVDWAGVAAAIKALNYDGPLVIESFSTEVKTIARAAAIWRPPAPSQDELAEKGLVFLKQLVR